MVKLSSGGNMFGKKAVVKLMAKVPKAREEGARQVQKGNKGILAAVFAASGEQARKKQGK